MLAELLIKHRPCRQAVIPVSNRAESVLEGVRLDLAGMISPQWPCREQKVLSRLLSDSRCPLTSVQTVICKPERQGGERAFAAFHFSRLLGEATLQGICSGKSSVCKSILPLASCLCFFTPGHQCACVRCLFAAEETV